MSHRFPFEEEAPNEKKLVLKMDEGEQLMKVVLELDDEDGLLGHDELIEGVEAESFIHQTLMLRGREFHAFLTVLNYNKIRYHVQPVI